MRSNHALTVPLPFVVVMALFALADPCLASRLDDARSVYNRGATLERQMRFDPAIAEYLSVVTDYADVTQLCADARLAIGIAYSISGRPHKAKVNLGKVISDYPQSSEQVLEAQIRLRFLDPIPDPAQAIADLRETVSKNTDKPRLCILARMRIADCLAQMGRTDDAAAEFESIVASYPIDSRARARAVIHIGQALMESDRHVEAVTRLQKVADYSTDEDITVETLLCLGKAQHRAGQLDAALVSYKKVVDEHPVFTKQRADAMITRGDIYQEMRHYDKAVDEYRGAINTCPEAEAKVRTAQRKLGYALEGTGRLDEALVEYDNAMANAAEEPAVASDMLFRRGLILQRKDDADKAIAEFEKIPGSYPGEELFCGLARIEIARCYLKKEQPNQAISILNDLASAPIVQRSPSVAHELAIAFFEANEIETGKTVLAKYLDVAAAIWPADRADLAKIEVAYRLHELDEIKALAQQFAARYPNNKTLRAEAEFFVANTMETVGDKSEAVAAYESLVQTYGGSYGDIIDFLTGSLFRIGTLSIRQGNVDKGIAALQKALSDYPVSLFTPGIVTRELNKVAH